VYQLIENAQNNVTPLRFPAPVWDGRFRIVPKRRSDDAACPAAASRQGNTQRAKGNDETMQWQRATCSMQPRARGGNDPAARGVESTAGAHVSRYGVGRSHNSAVASVNSPPTAETSTQCRKLPRPEEFQRVVRQGISKRDIRMRSNLGPKVRPCAVPRTHSPPRWHAYPRGSRYRHCTSMPCESRPAVPAEGAVRSGACRRNGLALSASALGLGSPRWLSGPGQPH
jgi:hypothetical protein